MAEADLQKLSLNSILRTPYSENVIKHQTSIRVRYAETDQMGYVHHSHYALYLEEARMELLHTLGIDSIQLEREGIILPVAEMKSRYSVPLRFGDILTVEKEIVPPWKNSLKFSYRIYKQDLKLVSRASTTLVFADKESGKLVIPPQEYIERIIKAFFSCC
jgi:acyl-CoA thioester hydrolase